jgi:uroporphyrin-III C-methyltransferase
MSDRTRRGVLVVGHGSRREEANADVREAARRIGERGGFPVVEAAFLEIAHPNIAEGFARLVDRGARHVIVHPYFLSPGRHTRGDIPVEVRAAAEQHRGVTYQITEPLAAHRLVIEASVERIRETGGRQRGEAEEEGRARTEGRREDETFSPVVSHGARRGTVYLVGAGPGDPGLLTLRARDLLASCDAVVYDYLVNPEVLGHVPVRAERVYVGKVGGGRQTPQPEINRLLIERAREGKRVVRLKGGDPFLFGRGGEEAEALVEAGVPFEVVPGVSSALAVPAYAGIPLTHRAFASSVAVLTGTHADDGPRAGALAGLSAADTVVVLMGMSRLREIAEELIAAGRSPETPAAVVRWGTYEGQQTVTGTLRTIKDEAERAGMRAPAVIVVGEVVALRGRLNWFEARAADPGHELEGEFESEDDFEGELKLAAVPAR